MVDTLKHNSPYLSNTLTDLFSHFVNTDAVMANSGHFSAVTSVEVVSSSAAGGLRPEVPLAASEEGMECYRMVLHTD